MKNSINKNDSAGYIRGIARRAFRDVNKPESVFMNNTEIKLIEPQNPIPKNKTYGLAAGLAIGVSICLGAYFLGFPFKPAEIAFITAQFCLLGSLVTYFNS